MAISKIFIRIGKYALGLAFVATAVILTKLSIDFRYLSNSEDPKVQEDFLFQDLDYEIDDPESVLNDHYMDCLRSPSKEYCLLSADRKVQMVFARDHHLLYRNSDTKNISHQLKRLHRRHPVDVTMTYFAELMDQLSVEATLIEPTMLFCMLTDPQKILLQNRRFNISDMMGSPSVITFALRQSSNQTLNFDSNEAKVVLDSRCFKHISADEVVIPWRDNGTERIVTHHFFMRRLILIHAVIFFERGSYLWHSKLSHVPAIISQLVRRDSILFGDADATFEKFRSRKLTVESYGSSSVIAVPDNQANFLLQIKSSRFVECQSTLNTTDDIINPVSDIVLATLRNIRRISRALLMNIAIIDTTVLEWYRDCKVLRGNDSKMIFVASSEDVIETGEENLMQQFDISPRFESRYAMGTPQEAYRIRFDLPRFEVQLAFLYEDDNGIWTAIHHPKEGYYYRYYYPKFDLCSAELLRQRILVPCNPKKVIETLYGPDWRDLKTAEPITTRNRGSRIYWPKHLRHKVYPGWQR